ncbi:hypothetical protein QFC21_000940 [Naganishia friedmannii]|uniref:Uncharacterized protein n=1 Tax=Naganishia friedmannii TaxID=89922 RepID=A0ACC2W9G2_9TREE|nr:hypothetical protein QFC21_000940 [Naganishia friedmannii]
MSQNLFGGLDRPTALSSDSPFAIASHAMADKSNPQAPRMKLPQSKAVAQAQQFAQQHQQQQQRQQQQQQQQQQQYQQASPSAAHPGNAGPEASALRTHARDAYMGAGAYNPHTGTYGAPSGHNNTAASPSSRSNQSRGSMAPPEMRLSRSPSPYTSTNPNFTAQQGFAQAVMMAQGSGGGGGSSGVPIGQAGGGGGAGGVQSPPAFPAHYQQQFAQHVGGGNNDQQVYSPAGSYQSAVSPQQQHQPHQQNQQNQIYTAPSPSQYAVHQSPSQTQNQAYGPSPPYHQTQQHQGQPAHHRPSSHHSQAPTSPYETIQSPGAGNYGSPAAPANLGSPAGQGQAPVSSTGRRGLVPPAPAGTDAELWQMFSVMDIDKSGQLEANEVQALLAKDYRWANIEPTEDCVKMLMNIFDTDRSGTINYVEFEGLYRYITDWYNIFQQFDRDRSGTIDRKELEQALTSFGYPLPSDLVRKLEKRYAPPKGRNDTRPRGVTFDRFLMACVTVKHFTEAFRQRDVHREGKLTVDYSTFMDLCLSSPA